MAMAPSPMKNERWIWLVAAVLGVGFWIWRALGRGYVPRSFDKLCELLICDRVLLDPKSFDAFFMHRRFLRVVFFGPHQERSSWNPHHAVGRGGPSRRTISQRDDVHVGNLRKGHGQALHHSELTRRTVKNDSARPSPATYG